MKETERHLWEKIKRKSGQGRRTGVGITAEGDMLAAMGLRYGTKEATEFSVNIHKTLALNAYCSSVTMAQERGAFEVFDAKREATILSYFVSKRLTLSFMKIYKSMVVATLRVLPLHPQEQRL